MVFHIFSYVFPCYVFLFFQRQGIIGVLVITTVTGFMVMYNNTSRAPSPSSSSQPEAGVILEEPPKRSTTDPITVLRGYKSFVDQKVNMFKHTLSHFVSVSFLYKHNKVMLWRIFFYSVQHFK